MSTWGAESWAVSKPTAVLVFADGVLLEGQGLGATGHAVGEPCFNTAMTGYQEILSDPSYDRQIITFTFPHIGNTGVTDEDTEMALSYSHRGALGVVLQTLPTKPSNHRARGCLEDWLSARGIIGIAGIDTRALTVKIRTEGSSNVVIAHSPDGSFDLEALQEKARSWSGLKGADLASGITCPKVHAWREENQIPLPENRSPDGHAPCRVAVLDFGVKTSILRQLAAVGCQPILFPAKTEAKEILSYGADGYLLSNGPGDPSAVAKYALPTIRALIQSGKPVFGICLGHQLLALALGARVMKMRQGHHGSNHPIKDLATGRVHIITMNHGFAVDRDTLPDSVQETSLSLFDNTNCGIRMKEAPVFSVQYHPEASPGPHDARQLFVNFADSVRACSILSSSRA